MRPSLFATQSYVLAQCAQALLVCMSGAAREVVARVVAVELGVVARVVAVELGVVALGFAAAAPMVVREVEKEEAVDLLMSRANHSTPLYPPRVMSGKV